ncbi:MAG TPA: DUF4012 domain-containing protein [Candidatus Sulfotelmatobacter sp.]|jgi:hypothetical protein|nr:DUF4012 domain-containing protein [Candidatus Sulfotelmatobacter sp.]
MSGFDKIEFNDKKSSNLNAEAAVSTSIKSTPDFAKSNSTIVMPKRKKKINANFKISRRHLITLGVVVLLVVLISIPAYAAYKSGLATYREAKLIATAVKQQNVSLASDEITKTQTLLNKTKTNFHFLLPLKLIPIVNWYYSDADHLMNAASSGLDSAQIITASLKPYADVLGLKGTGNPAGVSTSDRIKTAVLSLGKITPQIDKIQISLDVMKKEMDQVDPNHYPTFLFGKTVKTQLIGLKTFTDESAVGVTDAKPLIKTLPNLLGSNQPKYYLILFQNDKELRPTGGFITAYAIVKIDQGSISIEKSENIYTLDDSIPNKPPAPAPILKYFPGVYEYNLRDSNLSPDFMVSMKTFRSMYDKAGLKQDVNGIIAIDTNVLVSTIKILDNQVQADGQTFTTDKDPHCDCPQVIYQLENNISRPVGYVKTERKSLIGDLMSAIMVKSLTSSPKKYWGPLLQTMIMQTSQKDILYDLYDDQAQQGIEALNAAGRIKPFDGDYLHINDTNFSGAKVNIFMQESVDNAYSLANDGTITKTVTIHYKNPYPPSDCSLKSGGLCLNAEYRDWLRVYVPEGSQLTSSTGSQVKISTHNDLGKTVFEGFVTVRTEGFNTVTLTYTLPFKLKSGSPLPVMIQKQPGATNNQYNMMVNGNTVDTFTLTTDKTTQVKF